MKATLNFIVMVVILMANFIYAITTLILEQPFASDSFDKSRKVRLVIIRIVKESYRVSLKKIS